MTATATVGSAPAAVLTSRRWVILAGLIVATLLSSLDATMVATALPTIVGELGGFEKFAWVTTSYAVSSGISTLLLGKLGDLYGRRNLLLGAIAAFLVGAALSGGAQTIDQLIAFRAIQGIGGGGIWSLAFAVVGEIVPPRERGKYFGLFTGVFAVSGVAGPLVGGIVVDSLSWRWIFYVNLPLGLLSLFVVWSFVHLPFTRRKARFDVLGAVLVCITIGSLMVAIQQGSSRGWTSPGILGLFAVTLVSLPVFAAVEARAAEPLVPFDIFRNRMFARACIAMFMLGTTMMSLSLFFSLFFQDVLFVSPTGAGVRNFPMLLSMTAASIFTGRMIARSGRYRWFPIVGSGASVTGLAIAQVLRVDSPYLVFALVMALMGAGLGACMSALNIASQSQATRENLGIITSVSNYVRNLGGSIGLAVLGAMFNAGVLSGLKQRLGSGASDLGSLIREPAKIKALPAPTREAIAHSIVTGMHRVFAVALVFASLGFIAACLVPEEELRTESLLESEPGREG